MASRPERIPSPMLTRRQKVAADMRPRTTSIRDRAHASSSDPETVQGNETPTAFVTESGRRNWISSEPRPQISGEQVQFAEQAYDWR